MEKKNSENNNLFFILLFIHLVLLLIKNFIKAVHYLYSVNIRYKIIINNY